MNKLPQKEKYKMISDFYKKNSDKGIPFMVKYFKPLGISKPIDYRACTCAISGDDLGTKVGSGGHSILNKGMEKRRVKGTNRLTLNIEKTEYVCFGCAHIGFL